MRDKRGMRDKGLPKNTRTKRTMSTKVLPGRLRDVWIPGPGALTRHWRVSWRPGGVSGIGCCKLGLTKSPGGLALPCMTRRRERRAIWINRVLLVDTPYRC